MMNFLAAKLNTLSFYNLKALYELSYYSNIVYLIYTLGLSYILYPHLGNSIIYWYLLLLLLTFARIYNLYIYHHYNHTYSQKTWYIRFVILSLSSAILFSSLGFYFIREMNEYYQLLIILSLIGISSGASFSLAKDIHLNLTYIGILLLPLLCTVFFSQTTIHYFLVFLILIYIIIYVTVIIKLSQQSEKMFAFESKSILLREIFKNTSLGILTYSHDFRIIDINEMACKLLNSTNDKFLIGTSLKNLNTNIPFNLFGDAFHPDIENHYVGFNQNTDDNPIWIDVKTFSFLGKKFGIEDIGICIIEDKNTEYKAQNKLQFQATHDSLTGLLNRRGFHTLLNDIKTNQKHTTHYSILLYLDINQFKSINDSLGHDSGDRLLIDIANRLSVVIDQTNTIGRLGGDEFIILSPFVSNKKHSAQKLLQAYSKKVQTIFENPFSIQEISLKISASMGVALIEPNNTNLSEYIRKADISMYEAKYAEQNIVKDNILNNSKSMKCF